MASGEIDMGREHTRREAIDEMLRPVDELIVALMTHRKGVWG